MRTTAYVILKQALRFLAQCRSARMDLHLPLYRIQQQKDRLTHHHQEVALTQTHHPLKRKDAGGEAPSASHKYDRYDTLYLYYDYTTERSTCQVRLLLLQQFQI